MTGKLSLKSDSEVQDIEREISAEPEEDSYIPPVGDMSKIISTGSLLLDLAISGGRRKGGGVPGGILVEIYGPSGQGKTSVLTEMAASTQYRGGQARFLDPEGRLDKEYAQIYGLDLQQAYFDYHRPDTVKEMFNEYVWTWEPTDDSVVNIICADSLAALSTKLEMEDEDKMGMKRAKDFSEGLRKTCRKIVNENWILACSNQIRMGDAGETTPGGKGIPFYASVRIRLGPPKKGVKYQITKTAKLESGKEVEKVIGINSLARIVKSSVDEPFREAPISIIFGHGLDDIRNNLQYIKDMEKTTTYFAVDRNFQAIEHAIRHIEANSLEEELREKTMDVWYGVEHALRYERKPKKRG